MTKKSLFKTAIKSFVFYCSLMLLALATHAAVRLNLPDLKLMQWTVNDTVREAMVYIPENAKTTSTPIIFVFHGHGGTMGNMARSRGFEKLWPEAIVHLSARTKYARSVN